MARTIPALVLAVFWPAMLWAEEPSNAGAVESDQPVRYALIVTGSELVEGIYADSHTQFITRTLGPLGAGCRMSVSVGDRREDLLRVLRFAAENAPLIIVTGGLGPSDADLTRPALAEFTGVPLLENGEVLEILADRFSMAAESLPPNIRRQALIPSQGRYLKNRTGSAVGLVFDRPDQVVVALPGPPDELQPMVVEQLVPFLVARFGIHSIGSSIRMRFVGVGESTISQTIHQHLDLPAGLILSYQFEAGRVDLTMAFAGPTGADTGRLVQLEKALREHLGEYLYADDASTLEDCVIRLLEERGVTLSLAEVGSSGAVADALSGAANSERQIVGGLVAPAVPRLAALLDTPTTDLGSSDRESGASAQLIADRIRRKFGADWGVGVSERVRPDQGAPFVWMAVGSPKTGYATRKINLREGRNSQSWLVTAALDFVRRELGRQSIR